MSRNNGFVSFKWDLQVARNMASYSPHSSIMQRHNVTFCLLLVCCYQMVAAVGGNQKYLKAEKLPASKNHNATRRQDNPFFDALSKILPEDVGRLRLPSNYLTIVLNASGVLGLGFLWIKEITNAIGTPILAPILMPPLVILSAALLLIPDLSRLGELIDML